MERPPDTFNERANRIGTLREQQEYARFGSFEERVQGAAEDATHAAMLAAIRDVESGMAAIIERLERIEASIAERSGEMANAQQRAVLKRHGYDPDVSYAVAVGAIREINQKMKARVRA